MSNITTKPVKPQEVDVNKVKYSPVKALPSGAKIIYLNHGDGIAPLFVQTPEFTVPFDNGAKYFPDNDNSGKFSIKVPMDNLDSNPAMKEFHDMLSRMDDKIMNDGIENSLAWFKKKNPNVDVIKEPTRRKRSVWNVNKRPYKDAHFAVYPPELIEPCILAGSKENDIILDPFMGSGTTAMVAKSLGRYYLGCELHEDYRTLIEDRLTPYHANLEKFL